MVERIVMNSFTEYLTLEMEKNCCGLFWVVRYGFQLCVGSLVERSRCVGK